MRNFCKFLRVNLTSVGLVSVLCRLLFLYLKAKSHRDGHSYCSSQGCERVKIDQALLRPHTPHTGPRQDLAANPMPTVRMGSRWSQAWRRVAGPPLVRGSGQPRTPTQAATLSLSGEAGVAGLFPTVCFSFKSTTNRTPTCFLNKAGITSLRKACQTHKAYDVCVPTRVI